MSTFILQRVVRWVLILSVVVSSEAIGDSSTLDSDREEDTSKFKTDFLRLCDVACEELNKELTPFKGLDDTDPKTHHVPFFEDAHAVRALAVAYDITGKQEYLDACKHWSDRIIAYQKKMIPKGAYYLNYFRTPGSSGSKWFISDAGTIGMAVFATAVRCPDAADKQRYLDSVESFAKNAVMTDRIGEGGGIIEKLWGEFKDEWWCSTANFGSLALQLYEETGEEEYRKVGLGALHWMIGRDFRKAKVIGFDKRPSGVIFYDFQLHNVGMKYLAAESEERKAAVEQIADALKWMKENQRGRGGKPSWGYLDDGHVDMSGLPFHMYAFAHQLPEYRDLAAEADRELSYIGSVLLKDGEPYLAKPAMRNEDPPASHIHYWALMSWGMMSYAEKLSPGSIFRTSKP